MKNGGRRVNTYILSYCRDYPNMRHPSGRGDGPYEIKIHSGDLERAFEEGRSKLERIMSMPGSMNSFIVSADIRREANGIPHMLYDKGRWHELKGNGRKNTKENNYSRARTKAMESKPRSRRAIS